MISNTLQLVILLGFPALALWGAKKSKAVDALGPVIFCYLMGGLLANTRILQLDLGISRTTTEATVPLALPLILFSTDFLRWVRLAKKTVLSFVLSIISIMVVSAVGAYLWADKIPESAKVSGMLVGVYTGGTPNMAAIGTALGVSNETFVLINAVDVVMGGIYLLFVMSVAQRLLLLFLPAFKKTETGEAHSMTTEAFEGLADRKKIGGLAVAVGLSVLILALSAGISFALTAIFSDKPGLSEPIVILSLTTLGLAFSFIKRVRNIEGSYEVGQYLLLIFCVAIGTMADVAKMMEAGGLYFGYVGAVMFGSILLHYTLAAVFRIDADTVLITSSAAIYGPPFIGPIAGALKNKEIVVSGVTCGCVGLGIGNYLGILLAKILGG